MLVAPAAWVLAPPVPVAAPVPVDAASPARALLTARTARAWRPNLRFSRTACKAAGLSATRDVPTAQFFHR
jgi:hypothetical protein